MKRFLFVWGMSLCLTTPAAADQYDGIYRGLVAAAYSHMETAYRCRTLIGLSDYRDARVTAENSLRLSGMPTDIAFHAVERMVTKMQATQPRELRALSLADCFIHLRTTQTNLLAQEGKMQSYWQRQ
ncbi:MULTISPECIES: hypothetical protein [unclassified Rhizobium]|uniref:hypothetical protein n=1 Tax=unclassified Rhizobium TaxID=2613769 RepID=UPI0038266037